MRRWIVWTLAGIGAALAACAALRSSGGSRPVGGDFVLDAEYSAGYLRGGVMSATLHCDADAKTHAEFVWWDGDTGGWEGNADFTMDPADREALRSVLDGSRFFGWWLPNPNHVTDQESWTVTLASGGHEETREIYDRREFDAASRHMERLLLQIAAEAALDAGRMDVVASDLCTGDGGRRLPHPERILARLRTADRSPARAWAQAQLEPEEDVTATLAEIAAVDEDGRRQALLARFVKRGAIMAPLAHADAVAPVALAELERSWETWPSLSKERAEVLADCAGCLAFVHEVRAAAVFERIVSGLSTDERPFRLGALPALGEASIEPLERLLADERLGVRIAAAQMCEGLACELTSPSACGRPPGIDPAKLSPVFRERLQPKLERIADDASADGRLRSAAQEALVSFRVRPGPPGWTWHRMDW